MRRSAFLFLFTAALVLTSAAQTPALTAETVLKRVKANFDAVQDYTVTLTGTVDLERLKVPKMNVTLYFKQPNKFKTESKGTSFIPRNLLDINPADLLSKFDGTLMGEEMMDGRKQYKLRMVTKPVKGRPVSDSYIWVDAGTWTITRMEAYPSEGRRIEILIESAIVDGKYILPSRIRASFDFSQNPDSLAERVYNPNRIPRKGKAELTYSEYKVNTGLSDGFFEQKKAEIK